MNLSSDFNWIGAKLNGHWNDKVAVNIPITIGGTTHNFILDTGSPQSFIYCNSLGSEALKKKPGEKIEVSGSTSGMKFTHTFFCAPFEKNHDPLSDVRLHASGLLGMDFLEDKKLWLDLKNNRFTLATVHDDQPVNDISYLQASVSTHLYLHIGIPESIEIKAMFNTGPSLYPIITEKRVWEKLTLPHLRPEYGEEEHELHAGFQQKIILKSRTCKVSTSPTTMNLKEHLIYYPDTGSEIFCFKHLDYSAIIGLNMFADHGLYIHAGNSEFGLFTPGDEAIFHNKSEWEQTSGS